MSDVSITAASVAPISNSANGQDTRFAEGIAGASITAGQTVYATSGVVYLADGNASATAALVSGIAMHAATSGQPIRYANGGEYTCGFTAAVGAIYINSTTAGGIAPAADLATGNYTNILGIARTSAILRIALISAGVATT